MAREEVRLTLTQADKRRCVEIAARIGVSPDVLIFAVLIAELDGLDLPPELRTELEALGR
jgi:hypothetical protein